MDIAATIFNEARGEGPAGQQAVKAVIQNRMMYSCPRSGCGNNHGLANWRNTSIFHGYSSTKPNVPPEEQRIWENCERLSRENVSDNTNGATHFQRGAFNSNDFEIKVTIGKHHFAREKTEITRHR